jgi:hypothetical protein
MAWCVNLDSNNIKEHILLSHIDINYLNKLYILMATLDIWEVKSHTTI